MFSLVIIFVVVFLLCTTNVASAQGPNPPIVKPPPVHKCQWGGIWPHCWPKPVCEWGGSWPHKCNPKPAPAPEPEVVAQTDVCVGKQYIVNNYPGSPNYIRIAPDEGGNNLGLQVAPGLMGIPGHVGAKGILAFFVWQSGKPEYKFLKGSANCRQEGPDLFVWCKPDGTCGFDYTPAWNLEIVPIIPTTSYSFRVP